jgi:hypothetical protein
VVEDTEPLDNDGGGALDATTNLEGFPEEGKKVSPPSPFVALSLACVVPSAHNLSSIASLQHLLARAFASRMRGKTGPPAEARRCRGPEELAKSAPVDGQQVEEGGDEVMDEEW